MTRDFQSSIARTGNIAVRYPEVAVSVLPPPISTFSGDTTNATRTQIYSWTQYQPGMSSTVFSLTQKGPLCAVGAVVVVVVVGGGGVVFA